jgi:hypothetical protein
MSCLRLCCAMVLATLGAGCAVAPSHEGNGGLENLRLAIGRARERNLAEVSAGSWHVVRDTARPEEEAHSLWFSEFGGPDDPQEEQRLTAEWSEIEDERLAGGIDLDRGPLPSFWETVERDIKRMPRSVWDDTVAVYTDPGNLVILGLAGGASLAVRCSGVDGKMDNSHGEHDTFQDEWSDAIGVLGNPGTHFAMAGLWYLIGQQAQDDKTYEVGRTLFNALIINGVSTMALKVAANTESPNGENLAWPSGHTSSSFTVAEVLRVSYGPWVGIPSYALAALAGFGRIDDREHDFSDVLFGAALGIVVGHTVAEGHRPEIFGGEITAYVSPTTGASGIAWVTSF